MARDAGWWIGRLQAMSLPEVAHRTWRLARYPVDVLRVRTGTYARTPRGAERRLARWRGPERFYFDVSLASTPADPASIVAAESCCAGRRAVLGLGELALPDEPWHYEPAAQGWWPRVDRGRVIAAAPDHFDPRLTWELNRGHEWVVLARAHAATGDPRYRARLVGELDSWRRHNPVGIGINWVSAMEAAIRIHSLAWTAALLRGDSDGELWRTIGRAIFRHAGFVASNLSRFSSANNHLIVELSGLIVAARVLGPGGNLAAAHRNAMAGLVRELGRQIYADGVDAEMATHYHTFVLEALLLVAFLERAHGEPRPELETVIGRMADYLASVVCGDEDVLQHGDNDSGMIVPLLADGHAHQLIRAAAALQPTADVGPAGGTSPPGPRFEGARLLTGGAASASKHPAALRSRLFHPSGQVVLRGPRIHAVLDAGPFGFGSLAAHAHCDALAVAVAIDGQRFLVDRGTFRYNGDRQARDRFRMTAAHNTVQVGSREQGDAIGPFLWWRKPRVTLERCELTDGADIVEASHDGFAPVRHRRTLIRVADVLIVADSITGSIVHEPIAARWHFAPELELRGDQAAMPVGSMEVGPRATADVLGWLRAGAPTHEVVSRRLRTWHSDLYAAQTEAETLECVIGLGAEQCLVTAMAPGRVAETGRESLAGAIQYAVDRRALLRTTADALLASGFLATPTPS